MRRIMALLLLIAIAPGTLLRDPPRVPSYSLRVDMTALDWPHPPPGKPDPLGPLTLTGVWQIDSANHLFGGYSALVPLRQGRLLAIGDGGDWLCLPMGGPARFGQVALAGPRAKRNRDSEAATRDPASGRIWVAWEGTNSLSRHSADMAREGTVFPPAMAKWPDNRGAEAMLRLSDGRFIVTSEGGAGLPGQFFGVVFAADPVDGAAGLPFTFQGITGYRPTDMAELPDGRVLVLMRQLLWPLPMRFAIRLGVADPAELRPGQVWRAQEIAQLDYPLPIDNFEGLAAETGRDGQPVIWLISDDNASQFQRTLLWQLRIDMNSLPPRRSAPRKAKGAQVAPRAPDALTTCP